jgi:hypothetical protein
MARATITLAGQVRDIGVMIIDRRELCKRLKKRYRTDQSKTTKNLWDKYQSELCTLESVYATLRATEIRNSMIVKIDIDDELKVIENEMNDVQG